MEIARPATPQAGPQKAGSKTRAADALNTASKNGTELEAASPAVSPVAPDASSPAETTPQADEGLFAGPKRALSEIVEGAVAEPAATPLSLPPELEESDCAAAHLAGTPAAEIDIVDHKFQTLLATVRTNRPGDD